MTYRYETRDYVESHDLHPSKRMKRVSANFTNEQRMSGLKLLHENITVLSVTGLYSIKKNEIYHKWRPIVPERFWESTCPKPSDEVLVEHKDNQSEKRKSKKEKKAAVGENK